MNIIMHYPEGEEGLRALQKKVSEAHAEAIDSFIDKLTCPTGQKIELLNALIDSAKKTEV